MRRRHTAVLVALLVVAGTVFPASAGAAAAVDTSDSTTPTVGGSAVAFDTNGTNSTQLHLTVAGNATVDESTTLTVTNGTGAPVSGATVAAQNASFSGQTNTQGNVSFTFQNATSYTFVANKSDTNSTDYLNDTATVDVQKKEVPLRIGAPDSALVDGSITVKVYNPQDTQVEANVSVYNRTVHVPEGGSASVLMNRSGNVTLTATKADTNTTDYLNDTAYVDVDKRTHDLKLSASPSSNVLPNETVTFTLSDATASTTTNGTLHVVANGTTTTYAINETLTHNFTSEGNYSVYATKNDTRTTNFTTSNYENFTVQKQTYDLTFSTAPSSALPNESVKFAVKDGVTGYVNVTLHYDNTTTRLNGTGYVTFNETGNYTVTATKNDTAQIDYTNATTNVTVVKEEHPLSFSTTPSEPVRPFENVTFAVKDSQASTYANVTLRYNNTTTLLNGTGTVAFNGTGNYTVTATKNDTAQIDYTNATTNVTVEKRDVALKLTRASSGPVAPGENVTVTVKYATNGTIIPNATLRLDDNRTVRTGDGGMASFNFTTGRNHTVRTTMNDTATVDVHNDNITVRLDPVVIQPKLSMVSSAARPDNVTTFRVTESGSGNPIANATLSVTETNATRTTNASGYVTYTFPEIGEYTLTATKNGSDVQYRTDTLNVTARYEGIQLDLRRVTESEIQAGDVAAFRVVKAVSGDPVEDAAVHGPNGTDMTNADGIAYLRFNASGEFTLTSEKSGDGTHTWRTSALRVNVVRCVVGLNVTADDRHVQTGENVTLNVSKQVTQGSVANVSVLADNRTYTTDANGTVVLNFSEAGEYTVVVNKTDGPGVDYRNDTTTIVVRNDTDAPMLDVAFDGADAGTTTVNETTSANLTLSTVPNGLSGFSVNLTVSNASAAAFNVSETSVSEAFNLTRVERVDNDTIQLRGLDLNNTTEPGAEDVHLARIALTGEAAGNVSVTFSETNLDTENGSDVAFVTDGANLTVEVLAPVVNDSVPTNPDDDPQYEDVNGNGEADFNDVVTLFDNMNDPAVTNHTSQFDWNDNGEVDFADIVSLYDDV
ncbi:hypothetical protein [Halarchaeum sp. P4]|uniref:hypothetical protein n=1 Tax=Halarchaeum sp. P4 TaxID=3421639 RepID=UPI003EBFC6A8